MRVPKSENPHGISENQVWKRRRKDRPNKFKVIDIEFNGGYFAVVEYGKGKKKYTRKINLLNFGEYQQTK